MAATSNDHVIEHKGLFAHGTIGNQHVRQLAVSNFRGIAHRMRLQTKTKDLLLQESKLFFENVHLPSLKSVLAALFFAICSLTSN